MQNRHWEYTYNELPRSLADFATLFELNKSDPSRVAALYVLALNVYPEDPDLALEMIDHMMGPRNIGALDRQFYRERLAGKDYMPRSYFKGATPENNYTPDRPYTVWVSDNDLSYDTPHIARLFVTCWGADSPRPIVLREKPSAATWYVWEQLLTTDVKKPVSEDPWA